jgi:hypothetical protein
LCFGNEWLLPEKFWTLFFRLWSIQCISDYPRLVDYTVIFACFVLSVARVSSA